MNRDFYKIIKREYERKQEQASKDLLERKTEVYARLPRIEEIDHQIRMTGVRYSKQVLLNPGVFNREMEQALSAMDRLKQEKGRLLAEAGYSTGYLETWYECPQCRDTGYIETENGTEKCSCHKQRLIDLLYSQSNIRLSSNDRFSCFDENLYPDVADISKYKIDISPRKNAVRIRDNCLNFITNFDNPEEKNLLFSGPTGVGKTFLSYCIAAELLDRGRTVLYQTAPRLFDTISENKVRAMRDGDYSEITYKDFYEVDLLIIDDMGTEPPSAARFTELLNILSTRQMNNLTRPCKTIISTNMGIKQLYEYYDERIASRIVGNFDMFLFAGEDIRRLKRMNGA